MVAPPLGALPLIERDLAASQCEVDHWGLLSATSTPSPTPGQSTSAWKYSQTLAEAVSLGDIDPARSPHGEDWNCQNWVLAAVDKLKASGLLPPRVSSDLIRNGHEDALRKWKP